MPVERRRVAVQGFGKVGALAAQYFADAGCEVVAVCDVTGGRYRAGSRDVPAMVHAAADGVPVADMTGGDAVIGEELLELDVDVLVPAALEGVITAANADRVRAKFVVEGANGPTSPEADRILLDAGCVVVPDILANAGGVVVSYLEWVQNLQAYSWSEAEVGHRLQDLLRTAFEEVAELADERGLTLREAAHVIGVGRVAHAHLQRGLYPLSTQTGSSAGGLFVRRTVGLPMPLRSTQEPLAAQGHRTRAPVGSPVTCRVALVARPFS